VSAVLLDRRLRGPVSVIRLVRGLPVQSLSPAAGPGYCMRFSFDVRSLALRSRFFLSILLLAGCTHIERDVSPGRDPSALREIFVAANLADNHRLAERISAALRARGLRAESGPLTMRPVTAEAVLHYEDRWTWDFGEHMTYMRLDLHDPDQRRPYASAYRLRHIARSTDVDAVISAVVAELFRPTK